MGCCARGLQPHSSSMYVGLCLLHSLALKERQMSWTNIRQHCQQLNTCNSSYATLFCWNSCAHVAAASSGDDGVDAKIDGITPMMNVPACCIVKHSCFRVLHLVHLLHLLFLLAYLLGFSAVTLYTCAGISRQCVCKFARQDCRASAEFTG
jgi:hypothetical protein